MITQLSDGAVSFLAVVPAPIFGLDELTGENPDRIDKVDAMLEDIR